VPIIDITTKIKENWDKVFEIVEDMERFPEFMRDVKAIKLLRQDPDGSRIFQWEADIDGTPVEWVERNKVEKDANRIGFKMIEGDFQQFEGYWQISTIPGGSVLRLFSRFEWGVPNFEKYIGHILEDKASRSIRGMLWAVRKRAKRGQ